jgi:hypothetical protein
MGCRASDFRCFLLIFKMITFIILLFYSVTRGSGYSWKRKKVAEVDLLKVVTVKKTR